MPGSDRIFRHDEAVHLDLRNPFVLLTAFGDADLMPMVPKFRRDGTIFSEFNP